MLQNITYYIIVTALLFTINAQAEAKSECNLLKDASKLSCRISSGEMVMEEAGCGVVANVKTDGAVESFPHLKIALNGMDCRKYNRLRCKLRVLTDDKIKEKKLNFICCSNDYRIPGLENHPQYQQSVYEILAYTNQWYDLSIDLSQARRSEVTAIEVYVYEKPPISKHEFSLEIQELYLEGASCDELLFDGETFDKKLLDFEYKPKFIELKTQDGLMLGLSSDGDVAGITNNGKKMSPEKSAGILSGFFACDIDRNDIFDFKGKIESDSGDVKYTAVNKDAGLKLESSYRTDKNCIKVRGVVEDAAGKDRKITLYYALPMQKLNWLWGESISRSVPVISKATDRINYEYSHYKYPMSSITYKNSGSLSIAVDMNKPAVYRLSYNPKLGIYYIAFDFGLIPEKNVRGKSMSSAEFSFSIYSNDSDWGFRSSVEKYYSVYSECFEKRAEYGGWGLHRGHWDPQLSTDVGCRYSWQPAPENYKNNHENGVYNLFYIEPEFLQISMGDFECASREQVMSRLTKLAQGDEVEIEKCKKLRYFKEQYTVHMSRGGMKLWGKTLDEFLPLIAKATLNSVMLNENEKLDFTVDTRGWILDSNVGAMFACNIDPDIKQGKGWLNTCIALGYQIQDVQQATGVKVDGLALDCLLWYKHWDCLRERFKYSDFPISHVKGYKSRELGLPGYFTTIEWLRSLRSNDQYKDYIVMANLGSSDLKAITFTARELDVFGIENTHVPDPDFLRVIAGNKPVTDLHYSEVPEWRLKFNLLHAVFPGQGHTPELLRKYAPLFQVLAKAGWQPVTGAKVNSKDIRIERYGDGKEIYFVINNQNQLEKVSFNCVMDSSVLPENIDRVVNVENGKSVSCNKRSFRMSLASSDTTVVKVLFTEDSQR